MVSMPLRENSGDEHIVVLFQEGLSSICFLLISFRSIHSQDYHIDVLPETLTRFLKMNKGKN